MTPVWLAGVFALIPGPRMLGILGLYRLNLFWLGLSVPMKAPSDKAFPYTAAVVVCGIVITFVIGAILGVFTHAYFCRNLRGACPATPDDLFFVQNRVPWRPTPMALRKIAAENSTNFWARRRAVTTANPFGVQNFSQRDTLAVRFVSRWTWCL